MAGRTRAAEAWRGEDDEAGRSQRLQLQLRRIAEQRQRFQCGGGQRRQAALPRQGINPDVTTEAGGVMVNTHISDVAKCLILHPGLISELQKY
jgi:hypothetical protein